MKNIARFCCLLLSAVFALTLIPALGESGDVVTYTGFGIYKDDDHHTMEDSLAFRDTLEKFGIKFDVRRRHRMVWRSGRHPSAP